MFPDTDRRAVVRAGGLALGTTLAGCSTLAAPRHDRTEDGPSEPDRVDDWQFDPSDLDDGTFAGGARQAAAPSADVGFAAGGAKGVANYRRNLEEGYLPVPTDLSYEGLFYDYYFDTGTAEGCSSLFCPTYSTAIAADPLSGETERYLSVGLDSGLDASAFERKRLDLVVVLDISGSMGSPFDEYYYDRYGNRREVEDHSGRPKIEVAADAIASLTTHLGPGDRFGMVLFNDESYRAKPIRLVEETDMDAIRAHIRELQAGGGTRLSAGIEMAFDDLEPYADTDPTQRETRAIVLTDAMPNLGETSERGLLERFRSAANGRIYTTFVGIGVDFNTSLVDAITAIEGANYYSVHSADQFSTRLDEEFAYLVTPLVFDLTLELDAPAHTIRQVYGSTAAEEATGELVHVNTLFPSPTSEGGTRGGIVLVQLAGNGDGSSLGLRASWETRTGETREATTSITFPAGQSRHFGSTGVRKGVLLARYADLLKNWMVYERRGTSTAGDDGATGTTDGGIAAPPEEDLGRWERRSTDLTVSTRYRRRFEEFGDHFAREMAAIGDETLQQELEILRRLSTHGQ